MTFLQGTTSGCKYVSALIPRYHTLLSYFFSHVPLVFGTMLAILTKTRYRLKKQTRAHSRDFQEFNALVN